MSIDAPPSTPSKRFSLLSLAQRLAELAPGAAKGPVAAGAVFTMGYRCFNVLTGLAITVILARALGAEGFGAAALGLSTAYMLSVLCRCGADIILIQKIPNKLESGDWAALNGLRSFGLMIAIIGGGVVFLFGSLLAVTSFEAGPLRSALLLASAMAPLIALNAVGQGILRGLLQARIAYLPEFVIVQSIALVGVIVAWGAGTLTPISVLLIYAVAWCVAGALAWIFAARAWPRAAHGVAARRSMGVWVPASLLIMAAGFGPLAFGKIEMIALSVMASPEALGLFSIAFRFAVFAAFPDFAIANAFAPSIARLHAAGAQVELQRKMRLGARATLATTVAAAAIVAVVAHAVFPLIRPEFAAAAPLAAIISLGFVGQALSGRSMDGLLMLGFAREAALASLASLIVGFVLIILLTPPLGALGAALSTALSFTLCGALAAVFFARRTGVRCDILARRSA
ncbi:MAG: oligosaccharide flippase family protein [Pseudomonadota bacterium]